VILRGFSNLDLGRTWLIVLDGRNRVVRRRLRLLMIMMQRTDGISFITQSI
jgi:hypothetical protein